VLMAQGRYAEAARSLESWTGGGDWAWYARFNLGVALVRTGETVRGRQYLESVGTLPTRTEEQQALRDRANLALGFALLQERQPDPAAAALQRVRLDGPFTNRALLGLGWAEADAARPERALVPWLALRERPVLESAVQESLLAVPYAYARLAANGQAAEQYRHAVAAFAAETRRLDESIAAIRGGGFLDAVLDAAPDPAPDAAPKSRAKPDDADQAGWLWQLKQAPDAPHTRYLYPLLASHEFQEGLKNYRDLGIMQRNLERKAGSLEAFHEMVAARESDVSRRLPRKVEVLAGHCADAGRDPLEIEYTLFPYVCLRDDPEEARLALRERLAANGDDYDPDPAVDFLGPEERVAELWRPYLELGFTHAIADLGAPYDHETIERLPGLRALLAGA